MSLGLARENYSREENASADDSDEGSPADGVSTNGPMLDVSISD